MLKRLQALLKDGWVLETGSNDEGQIVANLYYEDDLGECDVLHGTARTLETALRKALKQLEDD